MTDKKQARLFSKNIFAFAAVFAAVLFSADFVLAAAPTVSSVSITTTSATIIFNQSDIVSAISGQDNYANSARNLSNYLLKWGTGVSPTTVYPLAGLSDYQVIFYASGPTDGTAYISGLNLTEGDNYSLTVSNVANTGLEIMTEDTETGTVAASTDPLINYMANTTGTAGTNNCYGYPCGKAGEQITIHGLRFDTSNYVQIYNMGSLLETVTPTDSETIVFTIPSDVSVGNNNLLIKNKGDNEYSNGKYFAVYSASCGAIKGILTNSSAGVGSDQNNVPIRLEIWGAIYGQTESHGNGYYAVTGYSNSSCQTGSYDVRFTTPAGASEGAPTAIGLQTVAANTITNASAKAFAIANITGYIKPPTGDTGMNKVTVTTHNDSWSVQQRAITNKSGFFRAYVPVASSSNYYTIEADPNNFYNVSPYLYMKGTSNLTISQSGSALNQTIRFTGKNVTGTVKTPTSVAYSDINANPSPDTVVPNAHVGIHTSDWSVSQWTNADSNGVFSFGVSARSDYILEVEAPWGDNIFGGYSKRTYASVNVAESLTNLDSTITGGVRLAVPNIFGRVMAGGSAQTGLWVNFNKSGVWIGANTNTEGKFRFAVSETGTYNLHVDSPSASYSSYDGSVEISTSDIANGKNLGDITLSAPNVTGKVYDPTGVAGQQNIGVQVCPYQISGTCYWGNTNSQGQFGIGTVPNGTWQLTLNLSPGNLYGAPSTIIVTISGGAVTGVSGGATNLNDIRMANPAETGLTGVVYGPTGSVGQQASLGLRQPNSMTGASQWANSDSNGQFAFGSVSAGTYEMEVMPNWGSSYSRKTYTITVAANGDVTSSAAGFTAVSARNIIVRLTSPNITGTLKTPLWNAAYANLGISEADFDSAVQWGWINIRPQTFGVGGPSASYGANTNASGVFSIGGVAAGDYIIEYNSSWGSPFSSTQADITVSAAVAAGTENLDLGTVRLSMPQVRGTIVKPDNVTAVQNAWVMAYNPTNWGVQPKGSNTDSSGKFTLGGLSDGTYTLEVNMPWGQGLVASSDLQVVVTSGVGTISGTNVTNNTIKLQEPSNTLSGWVKKSGTTAVANAKVEAHKDMGGGFVEATTDSSGNYSLKLSDGSWWVDVRPDWGSDIDWVYTESSARLTFGASSPTQTKNFSVTPTDAIIYGYVKKADATAVNNCWVSICQDKGMCNGRSTDSSGRFSIKVAAGTYRVTAFPPGDIMQTFGSPDEKMVTVAANSTSDAGTLTLKAKNSHIKGRVQDQAGSPIQNVVVNTYQVAAPGWGMTYTDTTGSYDITVSSGNWNVMVMPMSNQYVYQGGPVAVTVQASETKENNDFTLKLADSTIKGKVRKGSASGDLATDIFGGVWVRDTSLNDMLDFGGPLDDMMTKSGMSAASSSSGGMVGPGMEKGMGTGLYNGAFELKVPAGTYEIGIGTPPGSNYTLSATQTVTVTSNSTTDVNLVVIQNDATISGNFYKDNNNNDSYDVGEGVALRAVVNADKVGGGWQMTESNSGTGAYSLNVSAGSWYVNAFVDPFMSFGASQYMIVSSNSKLTITSGSANTLNFEVKELDATITGTVTDSDGSAMSGVWVFADYGSSAMVIEFNGPGGPGVGDFTDANGLYSINVNAGTYNIGAGIPPWDTRDLINPDKATVVVASDATSSGNNLQFKASDATISGYVTLNGVNQSSYVRAWSDSGRGNGAVSTNGSYSIKVNQGEIWHLVAAAKISSGSSYVLYESAETSMAVDAATEIQNLALVTTGLTIPDAKTVTFDSTQTKTLTLSDGLTLDMPAGSIATSGTVTVTVTPTVDVKPDSKEKPIGITYEFTARDSDGQEISDLVQSITITMPYNEDLIESAGYSEDSITPKYFNETTGTWENYDTVIRDTTNNNLIIKTDHFSSGGPVGEGGVPTAPSGLTASEQSSSRIGLAWTDNSSNETGFKIYRNSSDSGWESATLVTTTAANVASYANADLSASTTYYYRVKATNASGDSSWTSTASAATQAASSGGGAVSLQAVQQQSSQQPTQQQQLQEQVQIQNTAAPAEPAKEIDLSQIKIPNLEKAISQMTTAELRVKIAEFLSVIQQLQTLLNQLRLTAVSITGIPSNFSFGKVLRPGDASDDVKYLQILLNSDPDTKLTDSGPGSSGNETTRFGTFTRKALIKFQEKYAKDILTPLGFKNGTGIVGTKTLLKIKQILGR